MGDGECIRVVRLGHLEILRGGVALARALPYAVANTPRDEYKGGDEAKAREGNDDDEDDDLCK